MVSHVHGRASRPQPDWLGDSLHCVRFDSATRARVPIASETDRGAAVNVGPDGPEQRTAELQEHYDREADELDLENQLGDEAVDESLLDLAEARMQSYWLDKVTL